MCVCASMIVLCVCVYIPRLSDVCVCVCVWLYSVCVIVLYVRAYAALRHMIVQGGEDV